MDLILQLLFNGIAIGALYGIVALGLGLIYNVTKVFHIAHGIVYTAGAYLIFSTLILIKWPLYLSIIISVIGVMLLGILIEFFVYKPLFRKNAPLITSFISS